MFRDIDTTKSAILRPSRIGGGSSPTELHKTGHRKSRKWIHSLALLPGALLAVLPSATCPACIAAYAGVLSAVGLGFLFNDKVLDPLIAGFLAVGILSVAWSTRSHHCTGPFWITLVGSGLVVAGRLVWIIPPALYAGVGLLIAASVWNLWLKRPQRGPFVQIGASQDARSAGLEREYESR